MLITIILPVMTFFSREIICYLSEETSPVLINKSHLGARPGAYFAKGLIIWTIKIRALDCYYISV